MSDSQDVKAPLKATLEESLATARDLLVRVTMALVSIEATDKEWGTLFKRLEAASAKTPIRPYNRMYERNWHPASEPLFVGFDSQLNQDHYAEISDTYVDELVDTFQQPAVEALTAVFDDVTAFFRQVSARVLTLRFFSNSDVLLNKFETVLAFPWAQPIQHPVIKGQYALPYWIGTPVHQHISRIAKSLPFGTRNVVRFASISKNYRKLSHLWRRRSQSFHLLND